ncbi:TPA: hypothetical protein ACH3X1_010044 [Trebouxia sp. C0004]
MAAGIALDAAVEQPKKKGFFAMVGGKTTSTLPLPSGSVSEANCEQLMKALHIPIDAVPTNLEHTLNRVAQAVHFIVHMTPWACSPYDVAFQERFGVLPLTPQEKLRSIAQVQPWPGRSGVARFHGQDASGASSSPSLEVDLHAVLTTPVYVGLRIHIPMMSHRNKEITL